MASSPPPAGQSHGDDQQKTFSSKSCEELVQGQLHRILPQLGISAQRLSMFDVHASDISGDMNYVYRVTVTPQRHPDPCTQCDVTTPTATPTSAGEVTTRGLSVVVKVAPSDVPYLRESEAIPVDPNKIAHEHAILSKLRQLQEDSVPRLYLLDKQHKAIIMQDMVGYEKLTKLLSDGDIGTLARISGAVEAGLQFIGRVHRETSLSNVSAEERERAVGQFSNPSMRGLMSELLFDKPFDPADQTNQCNPLLLPAIQAMRTDPQVVQKVAKVKKAFLRQDDCLCHGDLATDNVLVQSGNFRIIDCEFSGIGLRAYDLALFLQMTLYQLLRHHRAQRGAVVARVYEIVEAALRGYRKGVEREEMMDDPLFVDQVCSLIACEFFWTRCSLGGDIEGEEQMLSLSKLFLLRSNNEHSVSWNIRQLLNKELGLFDN